MEDYQRYVRWYNNIIRFNFRHGALVWRVSGATTEEKDVRYCRRIVVYYMAEAHENMPSLRAGTG